MSAMICLLLLFALLLPSSDHSPTPADISSSHSWLQLNGSPAPPGLRTMHEELPFQGPRAGLKSSPVS
jgi:hypothetical protein